VNWDPTRWKRSRKFLLGLVTIWPPIYMLLFMVAIFSLIGYFGLGERRFSKNSEEIDLVQLQQKIRNGELSQLTIKPTEIVACDRSCECEYHTSVDNRSTKAEIIKQARELDQNGQPRVPKIDEETSESRLPTVFPIGMVAFLIVHFITIWLMLALMIFYIVLAVKREQFDQTTRIVWIILLCLMNTFAMPVYWYLYIWRTQPLSDSPATS